MCDGIDRDSPREEFAPVVSFADADGGDLVHRLVAERRLGRGRREAEQEGCAEDPCDHSTAHRSPAFLAKDTLRDRFFFELDAQPFFRCGRWSPVAPFWPSINTLAGAFVLQMLVELTRMPLPPPWSVSMNLLTG